MLLYLVRHGKAAAGADDWTRPLTDEGRAGVERMAKALGRMHAKVERIQHSGRVRARETADILQKATGGAVEQIDGLDPNASVAEVVRQIHSYTGESLMLVGHLPFMGRLATSLLIDDLDREFLHFRTGAIACLEREGDQWRLEWLLSPKNV